jgi:murein tripeptide amidase MpaA
MKKLFLIVFTSVFLFSSYNFAQDIKSYNDQKEIIEKYLSERNEVYFKFYVSSKDVLKKLANEISIDNVKDNVINYEVIAYANTQGMKKFREYHIDFEVMVPPSLQFPVKMSDNIKEITSWDVYPTYDAYVTMMNNFATTYPNICKIVNAGPTIQGRAILFAVISDSVNFRKPKPRFMYSSSIHGDETTGYVSMLRLIDTLLSSYGTNTKLTDLVKNVEIWINPLANPDGTYHGGNGSVNGATRSNYNGADLNRNYPDFYKGPHPDSPFVWQPETIAMMNLFHQYNFTLSMNFHGGTQVLNYPWDCVAPYHPDDDWWIHICKTYVDTVHSVNPSYMTIVYGYPNIPGITNGYAWYSVWGGRQDYMTFFCGGREITAELSNSYILPPAQLPAYYGYNVRSWINYIKECSYGVRGIVTDSVSGLPLKAKIRVQGREYMSDSTSVFSDTTCGDYHRMLPTGTFTLIFKAPNHYSKTISGVYAKYDSTTILNVKLRPMSSGISGTETPISFSLSQNYPNPFNPTTNIKYQIGAEFRSQNSEVKLVVYDILGKEIVTLVNEKQSTGDFEVKFDGSKLSSGIYFYKLTAGDFSDVKSMILIK